MDQIVNHKEYVDLEERMEQYEVVHKFVQLKMKLLN